MAVHWVGGNSGPIFAVCGPKVSLLCHNLLLQLFAYRVDRDGKLKMSIIHTLQPKRVLI